MMSNGTSPALSSEQDLASVPDGASGALPAWLERAPKRRRTDGARSWVCGMMPRADWLGSEVCFRGQTGKHLLTSETYRF
jgi:hypothetical protein